jgi:ComF family protein
MSLLLPFLRGVLDLVAPARCAACDAVLEPLDEGFCPACAPLLEPLAPRDGVLAAYAYGGPLADALRRFKYGGRAELAGPLGRRLAALAERELAGRVDRVVSVPLDRRRLLERGYDQAALLARPVARALGVPFDPDALARRRPTRPQAALDRERRMRNLDGIFVARRPLEGAVLLVDDVRTTGTTLAEAGRALLSGGAEEVRALVLAQAAPSRAPGLL